MAVLDAKAASFREAMLSREAELAETKGELMKQRESLAEHLLLQEQTHYVRESVGKEVEMLRGEVVELRVQLECAVGEMRHVELEKRVLSIESEETISMASQCVREKMALQLQVG